MVILGQSGVSEESVSTEELQTLLECFGGLGVLAKEEDELVCVPSSFDVAFRNDFIGEEDD